MAGSSIVSLLGVQWACRKTDAKGFGSGTRLSSGCGHPSETLYGLGGGRVCGPMRSPIHPETPEFAPGTINVQCSGSHVRRPTPSCWAPNSLRACVRTWGGETGYLARELADRRRGSRPLAYLGLRPSHCDEVSDMLRSFRSGREIRDRNTDAPRFVVSY